MRNNSSYINIEVNYPLTEIPKAKFTSLKDLNDSKSMTNQLSHQI